MIRYHLWCEQCDVHATTLPGGTVMQAISRFLDDHHRHLGVWVCPPGAQPGAQRPVNASGALDG